MPEAILDAPAKPRWFDRYSGNRIEPALRARVVDLLAEPRNHVSYEEIARTTEVCVGAIKAIEDQDRESISVRKDKLMAKSFRLADKSADRMEELIQTANLAQATICFGVSTDKAMLCAGEPTQRIEVTINAQDIYSELRSIQAEIVQAVSSAPAIVNAEFIGPALALPSSTPSTSGMDSPTPPSPT